LKKNKAPNSTQFVIFGGSGDLSRAKLIPALFKLSVRDILPRQFSLIALDRQHENRKDFIDDLENSLPETLPEVFTREEWKNFKSNIDYLKLDFNQEAGYRRLQERLNEIETASELPSKRVFYLATSPKFFPVIATGLQKSGLNNTTQPGWPRLVIEKPFGHDLNTACEYNDRITDIYPEENIYRIDHYLGKAMIQNILTMRFANMFFEPIWNKNYIDNIQIISTERMGIKNRGKYYDRAGALLDMVQSHLLQMLALIAMEPPADMSTASIRQEKIKVLCSLPELGPENVEENVVLGQYSGRKEGQEYIKGYQEEDNVRPDSSTETFAAIKLNIDNLRWQGVPFYLKTGKRLQTKNTKIFVQFKTDFHPSLRGADSPEANLLIIKVQPREGVSLQFNAKEPGSQDKIAPVFMDFCQEAPRELKETPAAYEELLAGLFRGDQSLFTHWQGVKNSWQFIDSLRKSAEKIDLTPEKYEAGSRGPEAAKNLIQSESRIWWDRKNINRHSPV